MKRVVILGPGGSGKSTVAKELGVITGLPVIELDTVFWGPDLVPTPRDQWIAVQCALVEKPEWIMDGDLGPYDAVEIRLAAADTVVFLDVPIWRCAWRALRRGSERMDFWRWLLSYRRRYRPALLQAIAQHAPRATVHRLSRIRLGHVRDVIAARTESPGSTPIPRPLDEP